MRLAATSPDCEAIVSVSALFCVQAMTDCINMAERQTKKEQRNLGNFHNKANFQNKTSQFRFVFAFIYLSASTNGVSHTQTLMGDCAGKQEDK